MKHVSKMHFNFYFYIGTIYADKNLLKMENYEIMVSNLKCRNETCFKIALYFF